jgi:sugar O-acyltransferase (sialic acid O-acetyltransferase NeuD family)
MSDLKKDLILVGGGGHCRSCIDVIESENKYFIKGILDQQKNVGDTISGYKILGTDNEISTYVKQGCFFLITVGHIGRSSLRKKLYQLVIKHHGLLATIISSRAYVAKSSSVARGSIVMHDALINANSTIGENCIINSKALIEHDCNILPHCHISTSAVLNGGVTVGEGTFFGSNAVSKQGVDIESNSFIKANTCFVTNKRKKISFLTTVFPTELNYITDFFESLSKQSFKWFDIIILNDGYNNFIDIKKKYHYLNIIELPAAGSIAKNRQVLIQYSKVNNYDIAIFGDIDDTFSEDRVEKSIKALKSADVIVNELTSIKDGCIIDENIYSRRLLDQQIVHFDFIKDKNIFGMSNTAVNLKVVPLSLIQFSDELIAVDWFFFSLLLLKGLKAIFISGAVTYYRQHDSNTVGIGSVTQESINKALKVKHLHYLYMQDKADVYKELFKKNEYLSNLVLTEEYKFRLVAYNEQKLQNPLWWELIDLGVNDEINK